MITIIPPEHFIKPEKKSAGKEQNSVQLCVTTGGVTVAPVNMW
jgi:hypothetical protein